MTVRTQTSYFFVMSVLLALLVFLGFAPTFYLRNVFGGVDDPSDSSSLPVHLVLHGLALTSWYGIFVLQAALVFFNKTRMHRKLGIAGTVSAVAVVVSGFPVLSRLVPRRVPEGDPAPPDLVERFSGIIMGQTINLVLFSLCVALAIFYRKRAWLHKRLMLIASLLVIGAALTTSRKFGAWMQSLFPESIPVSDVIIVLLFLSLPVADYLTQRKVHGVSIAGLLGKLGLMALLPVLLETRAGMDWVRWLGNIPQ